MKKILITIKHVQQCHISRLDQTYLRDAAGDVGVEVEVLLDGRHEDQLGHKSVVGACRCEVSFKHLDRRIE